MASVGACGRERDADTDREEYIDRLATAHEADTVDATVVAMPPGMPVSGGPISYTSATGRTFSGYEVSPASPDSILEVRGQDASESTLPGVLLIHEWWGLDESMRAQAERLAGEGYRVLAVDLFNGTATDRQEEARTLAQQAVRDSERTMVNLVAAYNHLAHTRNAPRVAVMGFCFGGAMALNAGFALADELDALVIYYGEVTADAGELEKLDMPILGIFGGQDESIPVDDVRAFEQALADAGRDAEVHVYDGAGHAFANPTGTNFEPEAARQAWAETTQFLAAHLYNGQ